MEGYGHNARDTRLRFSSGRLPVSSAPLVSLRLKLRAPSVEVFLRQFAGFLSITAYRRRSSTHGLEDKAAKGGGNCEDVGCVTWAVGDERGRTGLGTGVYEGHGSPGFGGVNDSSLLFVYRVLGPIIHLIYLLVSTYVIRLSQARRLPAKRYRPRDVASRHSQEYARGHLHCDWIETSKMPADGLTKILSPQRHAAFLKQLSLENCTNDE